MDRKSVKRRYTELHRAGVIKERAKKMTASLSSCNICPRKCGVDRLNEEKGICKTGSEALVSSYSAHFGEERPLVGHHGSGTIFFTNCNLLCIFCQNYEISHQGRGVYVSHEQLADIMLELQEGGCHNINLVTPTHVVPQILSALDVAAGKGLEIPLVYNTGGYDSIETLKELDEIVDIYMPDFKFWTRSLGLQSCGVGDYREVAAGAVQEMYNQVGDLKINNEGLAINGLLVRHLVLPGYPDETRKILEYIAGSLSKNTYLNVMRQYHPCGEAYRDARLGRSLRESEHRLAVGYAKKLGLQRIDY